MNCQKRILLTGMSGVGKTTILSMLQDENTICIDLDETNYVEVDVKTKEMKERINKRQNNNYGKDKEEWEQIVRNKQEIEPLLIRRADYIIQTDGEIHEVFNKVKLIIDEV